VTGSDSLVVDQEATGRPKAKGRIITFYSYKGGTGRSMALANVAFVLALDGNRVLVIDWDLEAPGIHRYFHPFLEDKELETTEGLLDMVENLAAHAAASDNPLPADQVDIINYIEPLEWPREWPRDIPHRVSWKTFGPRARIDLLPAGRQGPAYTRKLNAFNWVDFYEKLGGRGLLDVAKTQMRGIYDYILIDSRTGVSDTSGICTVEMPDTLVVCFTLNDQSIRGAAAVAESVREQRRSRPAETADQQNQGGGADHDDFRIFPVPTRVEITSERDKREAALDLAKETFSTFLTDMSPEAQARYWGSVQMAYFPFYAFEEIPAVFGDQPNELLSLTTAITQITRMITDPPVGRVRPLAEDLVTAEAIRKEISQWYLRRSARPLGNPARLAQEVFEQFDEQARSVMMRVLLRLVMVGPATEPSAKAITLEELADSDQGMVQTLADRRLVVISNTGRERSVALADGDLLKQWNVLREAIRTDRHFLMWRQTLGAATESWRQSSFDESALWRGKVLEEAFTLAHSRRGDLNATELRFIDASIASEQKRLASEEGQRADVASLRDALQKEREANEKLRFEVAAGSGRPDDDHVTGWDFGLPPNKWNDLPPAVRQDLFKWRQARRVGIIWFAAAIVVCGFSLLTHFFRDASLVMLATPTYLLIVIVAVGSLSAPLVNLLRRWLPARLLASPSASPESPSFFDERWELPQTPPRPFEWWEHLDPVIVMRATTLTPFFGSIRIASPWAEIGTVVYVGAAVVLSVLRYLSGEPNILPTNILPKG
jgi:MinD-like ATPase involved in chromosome partitioning or flagellar assembly